MMDALVRQPLTPAETKFGTPGSGWLFPLAVKQLRKRECHGALNLRPFSSFNGLCLAERLM